MRVTLILVLIGFNGLACSMAEDKSSVTTQPSERWSEPGVSFKADVSREDGLTRIDFSWAGLKEPGILMVNFDSKEDYYPGNRPGTPSYRELYGVTPIRSIPPADSAALVFDHERIAKVIQDFGVRNAYLTRSVRIHVLEDKGVKGSPLVRTEELGATDCAPGFVLVPSSAETTIHTGFTNPPVTKMRLEMPQRGGAMADVHYSSNVRAQVQGSIDLRLRPNGTTTDQ